MPPTFLIDSLNGVRRKVKILSVAFGVGVVLACAVGALLGAVLIDYLLNLHAVPRLVVIAAALGGLGYAAIRWVVKPVLARLSLSDVAGHLEAVFPQFDDRLRSTVNFVQQPASIPGSEMMKDRVVTEATALVQKTDLSQAVLTRPVWYSLAGAAGAVGLLVAISILLPPFMKIGIPRLLSPFANNPWPKSVLIDAAALPNRVPVGQRVDLSLTLKKGDRPTQKAMVYYQYDNGPVEKEYMIRGANGRYTASLDARPGTEKLTVWMTAGDDETDRKVIQVVPRLAIQSVQAVINAPPYAQMPPTTVDLSKAPAFMVTGSKVALHVQFNKPLDPNQGIAFNVIANTDNSKPADPGIVVDRAQPAGPVGSWVAKDSFRFRITATDLDGFTNTALEEYEAIVKPDQLPTVVIESPKKTIDRSPDAYLPLQILAEDDFGIASFRLLVDRIATAAPDPKDPAPAPANTMKHWEIPLKNWARIDGTGERQRFRLNWDWELKATLGALKPGDVLEYFVEVRDNYQLESTENGKTLAINHPPQFSSKLRVNILSEDEIIIIKTDEMRQAAAQTKSVESSQLSNQAETKNLQQDTKDKPELSKGDKSALENASSRESTIGSQTTSIASKLDQIHKDLQENRVKEPELSTIAKEAKQDLEQAAAKPMTDAANDLNRAAQSKTNSLDPQQQQKAKDNRNQALEQSQQNQGKAAQKLQDAIAKMDKVGTMSDTIKKFEQFDAKQKELQKELKEIGKETLGKKAEDLTPEQQAKLKKNADEQKKLADQIDEAVKQMEKMAQQMSKSDPQSAEAMKQAAEQAKSQQITPQQRQAADQAQKNQQAPAQNAQQQAELGIQVVLNTLKDAERRKLEKLKDLLDKAVEQIADLVRRQAGHNIDNLDLQGAEIKAKAMTKEELEVLYAKAKRDQKPGPKVELPVITSGQETTERNTRSIAKTIEDEIKEGGAIIAQDLVRAAGKMGYAIVDLRDKKLATAYNPHQVEALNALDQALKKAEDALAQAKKKIDEKKAEAIKARLEAIRLEQIEKVNKPTQNVDKARKADGTLLREDAVLVGLLVGAQGEIAKTMAEIADALRELGGVIYNDAAKDVVTDMNEVKEDLGKQKTGQTTQLEEARIIEQLDAMIDSLKQEIDKSKFDQKNGGGGGGGGGKSKFPTEAELRLLRALQTSINNNTKNADKLPKEQQDKVALVNLGNRQGKLRGLLDNLLKQATQGKEGLKPEPDPKDKLPEEAGKEQIENQEIDQDLLGGDPQAQKETKQLNRVGDRMARSRQRLALDGDPGKVTQEIQKRIVVDISDMIKQAQQQQANSQPKPGQKSGEPKPGEQPGQQKPGNQSQPNNAQTAAQQSTVNGGGSREAQLAAKINETNKEWGNISPRLRQAVIEGSNESIPAKYQKLVEDYYRGVSTGGKQP